MPSPFPEPSLEPSLERAPTARDRAVDVLALACAVLIGLVAYGVAAQYDDPPGWLRAVDLPLGALACLSLLWRRRHPMAVALLAVPALALSNSSFGAGMVITATLALYVPWRRSLPVLALYVAASVPNAVLVSGRGGDEVGALAFVIAYYLVFFAWGSALRSRRQLVVRLREDAVRERAEHARRLADTRRAERTAIAREMHDVLAHRISLLSVHAGALAYRMKGAATGPPLDAAEVAESAEIIRDNAHQALEELHEVLVVLRTAEEEDGGPGLTAPATGAPQPRLADVPALVAEARAAGQEVDFQDELGVGESVADGSVAGESVAGGSGGEAVRDARPQLQRTAYRAVQEGLTNARKHAPGTRVTLRLSGAPGSVLAVDIANPLTTGARSGIPSSGAGLVGLAERVALDGGTLEHGGADGVFTVRVRLPWPAR